MTTVAGPEATPDLLKQLKAALSQQSSTPKASENKPTEDFSTTLRRLEDAINAPDNDGMNG